MTVKFQKTSETSKSFENNILSRAIQSIFEINIAQFFITVVAVTCQATKKFAPVMFHRGRNKPNFKRDYLKDLKF